MERYGWKLVIGVICLLASGSLAMAENTGKVSAELKAFKVLAAKDGREVFVNASVARPGETIEYRIRHANGTNGALQGLVVNGAIPAGTVYVAGSESKSEALMFQAKVKHGKWAEPPLLKVVTGKDGKKRTVEVPPRDYAAVRWVRREALAANAQSLIKYRVQVAQ